jgi:peptidoglycan/xylan/chitin deacetylase (PgdA/CDA1 family)
MRKLRNEIKTGSTSKEPVEQSSFQKIHARRKNYRAYRRYEKKRHQKTLRTVAIVAAIVVLVGAFFWLIKDKAADSEPSIRSETLSGIDIETIIEWNNTHIAVHYPRTKSIPVNKALADFANQTVKDFKNEVENYPNDHDELNMSFKTYRHNDDIVSFAFDKYVYHQKQANGIETLSTMTFNLKTGYQYQLEDVLTGDYLDELSERAINQLAKKPEFQDSSKQEALKEGLSPKADNFHLFILDKDEIVFLFSQYQFGSRDNLSQRVIIPLKDIRNFLKEPFRLSDKSTASSESKSTAPPVAKPPEPADASELAGKKLVAVTFDDGPHPTNTNTLLDMLRRENAKATFFVLGTRVDYYGDIVRRAYQDGHQIASHTRNHKDLTKLSADERRHEINSTISSIENTIGVRPTAMRPPYGSFNEAVKADAGMALVLWSIDTEDWKYRNADTVHNKVMSQVRDGSIVLMHDIHATTIQAAAKIVPDLKAEGYTLVTVDELIKARGGNLNSGSVYRSMYP